MTHHLHFLPLTTLLQACYARVWVISTTIYAHVQPRPASEGSSTMAATVGYRDVIRFAHPMGAGQTQGVFDGRLEIARVELDERTRFQTERKGKSKDESFAVQDEDIRNAQTGFVPMAAEEGDTGIIDFGTRVEREEGQSNPKTTSVIERRIRKKPQATSFSQPGSGTSTPGGDRVICTSIVEGDSQSQATAEQEHYLVLPHSNAVEVERPAIVGKKRKPVMEILPRSTQPSESADEKQADGKVEKKRKVAGSSGVKAGTPLTGQVMEPPGEKAKPVGTTVETKLKKKKKKKADDMDDIFGF